MNGINSKDRFSFAKGYRARTIFLIFDILLLGILMCMMVLPLLKVIVDSIDPTSYGVRLWPRKIDFSAYEMILTTSSLYRPFLVSVLTTVVGTVTGLFIIIEDSLAIDDYVDVGGHLGTVEGLTIRTVRLRDIDGIGRAMIDTFACIDAFEGVAAPIRDLVDAAKIKTEILRTDPGIFDVWASLVTASERLANFTPKHYAPDEPPPMHDISDGLQLIRNGRDLIFYIARARTPMPKSMREYVDRCETYLKTGQTPLTPAPLPA